jgi:hypothetical protein
LYFQLFQRQRTANLRPAWAKVVRAHLKKKKERKKPNQKISKTTTTTKAIRQKSCGNMQGLEFNHYYPKKMDPILKDIVF